MDSKTLIVIEDSSKSSFGGGQRVTLDVIDSLACIYKKIIVIDHGNPRKKSNFIKNLKENFPEIEVNYLLANGKIQKLGLASFSMGKSEIFLFPVFFLVNAVKLLKIIIFEKDFDLYCATKKSFIEAILIIPFAGKIFFHIHSPLAETWSARIFNSYIRAIKPRCIAVSKFTAQTFINIKTIIIYNGAKLIEREEVARSKKIAFIGSLLDWKGITYFLTSAKNSNLSNFTFDVYGDGPDRQKLESMCSGYSNIRFHGFKNNMEEILRSDIDMVVLPSIATESCPMTIIESICAGIPVITTNIGGQYELLADGGGVTVSPRSPDEITQAILKINENYKDYAAVAKKTGEKYSIGKFQENIRNLFEND